MIHVNVRGMRACPTATPLTPALHGCCCCCRRQSPDKTLRLLTNFWHVLTKEEGNESLLRECIEWIQARAR